jgi:CheY-like chemotaxis protein/KaiC/GvpD/RAD55 family RecA-like ATPase
MERDPFLGEAAQGLLKAGRFHVLQSDDRQGASTLLAHFVAAGLSRGERGILVTERPAVDVLRDGRSAGVPLEDAVRDGKIVILKPRSARDGGSRTPSGALLVVDEIARHLSGAGGRVAIDPLDALVAGDPASPPDASFVTTLLGALDDLGATVLAAVASPQGDGGLAATAERFAHARLHLAAADHGGDARLLEVTPVRGAGESQRAYQVAFGSTGLHCARLDDEAVRAASGSAAAASRTILIVDPNPERASELAAALEGLGQVAGVSDHQEAAARLASGDVSALLLDLYSGGGHAYQFVARAREGGFGEPVLILCPRGTRVLDRVRGLRAGADDLVERPAHPDELRARVEALLRRGPWIASPPAGRIGDEGFGEILRKGSPSIVHEDSEQSHESLFANEADAPPVLFSERFAARLLEHLEHAARLGIQFSVFIAKFYENGKPARGDAGRALQEVLLRAPRGDDLVLRSAEGEFAAILLGTATGGLEAFRARLQHSVDLHFYRRINDEGARIHHRMGSASWPEHAPNRVPAEIVEALLRSYAASLRPLEYGAEISPEAIVDKISPD